METPDLQPYLEPGERVLWTGRPHGGLIVRRQDVVFGPVVAIFWLAVMHSAVGSVADAFKGPTYALGLVFFAPFLLMALYLIPGRYILDAMERRRMIYAVTDRRAIIVDGLFEKSARARPITADLKLKIERHSAGGQSVRIGPTAGREDSWFRHHMFMRKPWHTFCFERAPDGEAAYRILRAVQAGRT